VGSIEVMQQLLALFFGYAQRVLSIPLMDEL
jgi:hypothetical protein